MSTNIKSMELDIKQIAERFSNDINFFKNKTIFITGATGFFGLWLLYVLVELNNIYKCNIRIFALSRDPSIFIKKNPQLKKHIFFIKGDIRSFILDDINIDYCFHMATTNAHETFKNEDQINKIDLLYNGTKNLMQQLIKADVKKIIFTSSGVVYGALESQDHFSEDSFTAPSTIEVSSALAEGKRLAEYIISYYCKSNQIPFNIARCFSFVGQNLPFDIHYAVGNFINDALNNDEIIIKGTGKDIRSYLFAGDAITWLLKILITPNYNQIYNVGSGRQISINSLAELVGRLISPNKNIVIENKLKQNDNFMRSIYVPNINKIIKDLGVEEWTSIEEAIIKTASSA
jgi:UDP-glucuronate decarboxylase